MVTNLGQNTGTTNWLTKKRTTDNMVFMKNWLTEVIEYLEYLLILEIY
jgi:hypothetical protein